MAEFAFRQVRCFVTAAPSGRIGQAKAFATYLQRGTAQGSDAVSV